MSQTLLEGMVVVEPAARVVSLETQDFSSLMVAHLDRAYRLAWAILGDDDEAQDATQEAFIKAWRNRRSLRDPARIEAWLSRILVNSCRDRLRARARFGARIVELDDLGSAHDHTDQASTRDELDRALGALDPDHRVVVILRFWADLTVDDIAARLGVPSGTVKSRLHHSMRTLRSCLEDPR
jgi:RNA polymerase sigma-70 factor (ECF subfamily)